MGSVPANINQRQAMAIRLFRGPALSALFVLTVSGCGGGGSDAGTPAAPSEPSPTVPAPTVSAQPQSVEVQLDAAASFSASAQGTDLLFKWQKDGVDIAGATAATLTLPKASLADSGHRFRVIVSNTGGSVTSQEARLMVTDKTWRSPQVVDADDKVQVMRSSPRLAVDGLGNEIAVWSRDSDQTDHPSRIWVSRFDAQTSAWSAVKPIDTPSVRYGDQPEIATNTAGDTVVVWQEAIGGGVNHVMAADHFSDADVWTSPTQLDTSIASTTAATTTRPHVSIDATGNAIAVWRQIDAAGHVSVGASRFDRSKLKWEAATLIDAGSGVVADAGVAVATDGAGNAIALWLQSDGARNNLWANRFDAATKAWGSPGLVESDDTTIPGAPSLTVQANGNALAIWPQGELKASWYNASTRTWGAATDLDSTSGDTNTAQAAVDANGNAMAIWRLATTNSYLVRVARFEASSGQWGSAATINTTIRTGGTLLPRISFDAAGNAMALFANRDKDTLFDAVKARRFYASSGEWGASITVEQPAGIGSAGVADIACHADGRVVSFWSRFESGGTNITKSVLYASHYTVAP